MASLVTADTGIAALIHASNNKPPPTEVTTSIFGEDGFTFGDIIDIINPLQHIPVVNSVYRKITGDTIAPAMEIAGGALFGGPLGAAISVVSTAFNSYIKTNNNTPDSPYQDNPADNNTTAIAGNSSRPFLNPINIDDYSASNDLEMAQPAYNNPASNSNWTLSSEFINKKVFVDKTIHNQVSMNAIKNNRVYQPADGIVNMAYKNTERYTNVITSTETPEKVIDIIIGNTSGPG